MACAQPLSCVQLFATPLTTVHQAPLSMGFPRQEYWEILGWVASYFSRGSSWTRDRTHVSCATDGFFTTEPYGNPLVSLPGIKPVPPAVEAGSPNHWTARAFPQKTPYVQDSNGFPKCGSVFAISGGYWPPVFLWKSVFGLQFFSPSEQSEKKRERENPAVLTSVWGQTQ